MEKTSNCILKLLILYQVLSFKFIENIEDKDEPEIGILMCGWFWNEQDTFFDDECP